MCLWLLEVLRLFPQYAPVVNNQPASENALPPICVTPAYGNHLLMKPVPFPSLSELRWTTNGAGGQLVKMDNFAVKKRKFTSNVALSTCATLLSPDKCSNGSEVTFQASWKEKFPHNQKHGCVNANCWCNVCVVCMHSCQRNDGSNGYNNNIMVVLPATQSSVKVLCFSTLGATKVQESAV